MSEVISELACLAGLCNTWLMLEQQKANRARTIGSLIGVAAVLVVLAWKFLVHYLCAGRSSSATTPNYFAAPNHTASASNTGSRGGIPFRRRPGLMARGRAFMRIGRMW